MVSRCHAVALAVALSACSVPHESDERASERWVVVDGALTDVVESQLAGVVEIVERRGPVAIGRVDVDDLPVLSEVLHERTHRCGGFTAHESAVVAHAMAAAASLPPRVFAYAEPPTIDRPEVVAAVQAELRAESILETILTLSSYRNRYYQSDTGVEAAEWIADRWRSLAAGRADVTVELISHSFRQPSVALTITGSLAPDEIVVIGGHLDSISSGGSSSDAPGADDNASGIATITEVLRGMFAAGIVPERTVVAYGYAGEEVGLLGSEDIADRAAAEGRNIVGVLQLDMTNYQGSSADMAIIKDYTDPALTAFLEELVDVYVPDVTRGSSTCGYACSDHASWYYAGFPAAHAFEATSGGMNPAIHTPSDTIDMSGGDADHAFKFARLGAAFVVELSNANLPADDPTDPDAGPDGPGPGDPDGGFPDPDGDDDDDGPAGDDTDDSVNGDVIGGCAASGAGQGAGAAALLLLAVAISSAGRRRRRARRSPRSRR